MTTALMPPPLFSHAAPPAPLPLSMYSLHLAAQCLTLKAQLVGAQTIITAREECIRSQDMQSSRDQQRIANLIRRNQQLTSALHRTACAG